MNNSVDILSEILEAETRIGNHILETPLIFSDKFSADTGGSVYLKMESEQVTGAFKARGALNTILKLNEDSTDFYPVTASTGNHALGLAWGLQKTGQKGRVILPLNVVSSKLETLQLYDIDIEKYGNDWDETENYAKRKAAQNKWTWVSPYNSPYIIGGQGTIAVELFRQAKTIDNIFVTVGGGGLASGIATYAKAINPDVRIIGCQPERSPEMYLSIKAGKRQVMEQQPTLSDGSAGSFEEGSITFDLCRNLIDEFILISEDEIKRSILSMIKWHHKIIEGAAAVALSALFKEKKRFRNSHNVVIICGGNLSADTLKKIMNEDGALEKE